MSDDLFHQQEPSEENADFLAAAVKAVSDESAALKGQLDESKALQKFLEELINYRDKNWSIHLKVLCDKELERLNKLRKASHSSAPVIDDLHSAAKQLAKRMPTMIPFEIERLAKMTGLAIDMRSRHPRYFFGTDGFLEVRIDDQKLTATVSTREGKLATLPADPGAILEAVNGESKRLFDRKFNGTRFLADVRKAYLAAIKTRKDAHEGEPIPIREIYNLMAEKEKGYKRDEFLIDLSTLVEQGPAETSGFRFDLQQTKDTQEGVLLLGAAGRGMVNLLVFKKSNTKPL